MNKQQKEHQEAVKDNDYLQSVIAKYNRGPLIRQYRHKATTIKNVSWVANAFSLLTAIYAVWYLANLYDGLRLWIVLLGGIVLLAGIEFSKRLFAIWAAEGTLNPEERSKVIFALPLILLVSASFVTSRYGGDQFVRNETTKPAEQHTALRDSINEQIRLAYADIAVMKRQTWRGKITREAKRTIEGLNERINDLTSQRMKLENRDLNKTDEAWDSHVIKTASMGAVFGMVAGCMDFILILLLSWAERIEWNAYCLARSNAKAEIKKEQKKVKTEAPPVVKNERVQIRAFQQTSKSESRAPAHADAQAHARTHASTRARTHAPTRTHAHARAREEGTCKECGKGYTHKAGSGSSKKFCSRKCSEAYQAKK